MTLTDLLQKIATSGRRLVIAAAGVGVLLVTDAALAEEAEDESKYEVDIRDVYDKGERQSPLQAGVEVGPQLFFGPKLRYVDAALRAAANVRYGGTGGGPYGQFSAGFLGALNERATPGSPSTDPVRESQPGEEDEFGFHDVTDVYRWNERMSQFNGFMAGLCGGYDTLTDGELDLDLRLCGEFYDRHVQQLHWTGVALRTYRGNDEVARSPEGVPDAGNLRLRDAPGPNLSTALVGGVRVRYDGFSASLQGGPGVMWSDDFDLGKDHFGTLMFNLGYDLY